MTDLLNRLLDIAPLYVFIVVAMLVFAEDALFVGFVIPGETAAVLGGVDASRGRLSVVAMCIVVVLAAIAGDTVGYSVGRRFGPRLLATRMLALRSAQIDRARILLGRRGGPAVLLGRFVAFLRAVMPALAGMAEMPYRRFLPWNVAGGAVWGVTFVLIGYLAGHSYQAVASRVGTSAAILAAGLAVAAITRWRIQVHRGKGEAGRGRAGTA